MYEELIQHKCERHEHPMVFRNMKQLDTHCRRDHELFFCDLCTNHLKVRKYIWTYQHSYKDRVVKIQTQILNEEFILDFFT